jgi:hypothetical protein
MATPFELLFKHLPMVTWTVLENKRVAEEWAGDGACRPKEGVGGGELGEDGSSLCAEGEEP